MKITLSRAEFRDRVYACWLGKNIGGTLGTPHECKKYVLDLQFYDPVPTEPLPNDDLDLQLVWLQMLEERGVQPKLADFAVYWKKYLRAYPWNEYGFAGRNLDRGLLPPISGWFENYYVDEMGSPIRSEIWACVSPADPESAADMAWMDSAIDHSGGEGTYGEMFWSALESAAFCYSADSDPRELIRLGLSIIPPACQISRVIREVLWCYETGKPWREARERVFQIFGHPNPCNAIPNHGFTIIGWLYGKDFGDRLLKAVNCGYDTDCTGATLGSVLGILGGTAGIPEKWSKPVGDGIKLHKFTGAIRAPKTVAELTDRTVAVAEKYLSHSPTVALGEKTKLPDNWRFILSRSEIARAALRRDPRSAYAVVGDDQIVLNYNGDPVFQPGEARCIHAWILKEGQSSTDGVTLRAPAGWRVSPIDGSAGMFEVIAPAVLEGVQAMDLRVQSPTGTAAFRVLTPEQAAGFPANHNVPMCPKCQGALGTCICKA